MTEITELWTNRQDFRDTKVVTHTAQPLAEGEVLMQIEKFGLTSNNVSYALSGDMIGYWGYFPADDGWGKVPAWGFAKVVESRCDGVQIGERVWGFFPMASHVVMSPGKMNDARIVDVAAHRSALPALYNAYMRTSAEPDILSTFEDQRCILFPLFATSYALYDFLIDNDFFGAEQVLIGSASSKTGFGLAHLLFNDPALDKRVVALTSDGNVPFCKDLGCFHDIVTYGAETTLPSSMKSVFIDMSGDAPLAIRLHEHFSDHLVSSWKVGATHWEATGKLPDTLPGATPTFFFAPSHIGKRDKEWGAGKFWEKAFTASIGITKETSQTLDITERNGAADVAQSWVDLLDNNVSGRVGLIARI